MQVPSLDGSFCLATYLDEYSKLSVIRPVKWKSEVTGLNKEVINFFEKQSGFGVLTLRSDNGTEYLNNELENYLNSNLRGIQHQTTARYRQGGRSEYKTSGIQVRCSGNNDHNSGMFCDILKHYSRLSETKIELRSLLPQKL